MTGRPGTIRDSRTGGADIAGRFRTLYNHLSVGVLPL